MTNGQMISKCILIVWCLMGFWCLNAKVKKKPGEELTVRYYQNNESGNHFNTNHHAEVHNFTVRWRCLNLIKNTVLYCRMQRPL